MQQCDTHLFPTVPINFVWVNYNALLIVHCSGVSFQDISCKAFTLCAFHAPMVSPGCSLNKILFISCTEVQQVLSPRHVAPVKDLSWQQLFGLVLKFEIGRIISVPTESKNDNIIKMESYYQNH